MRNIYVGRIQTIGSVCLCLLALLVIPSHADELGNICVVFVVDTSGSMNDIFSEVTNALVGFVESTRDGDMTAIIVFDSIAHLYSINKSDAYLRSFSEEMLTNRRFLSPRSPGTGQTQIVRGLGKAYQLIEELERDYSYPSYAIILLTDGDHYPEPDPQQWRQLLSKLKQKSWSRFAVSLKRDSDSAVRRIADEFAGEAFYYDSSKHEDLKRILDSIRKRILIELEVSNTMLDLGEIDGGKIYTADPLEIKSPSEHSIGLSPDIKQLPFGTDVSSLSFGPEKINVPNQNVAITIETTKAIPAGDYAGVLKFMADRTVVVRDADGRIVDGISFRFHIDSWWGKYGWIVGCLAAVFFLGLVLSILLRPKSPVVGGYLKVLRTPDKSMLPEGKTFYLAPKKKTVVQVGRDQKCDVRLDFGWVDEIQFQLIAEGGKNVKLNRLNGTILVGETEVYREKQLVRDNRIVLRHESEGAKEEIELQYRDSALPRRK